MNAKQFKDYVQYTSESQYRTQISKNQHGHQSKLESEGYLCNKRRQNSQLLATKGEKERNDVLLKLAI